jgi:hypothetical protein
MTNLTAIELFFVTSSWGCSRVLSPSSFIKCWPLRLLVAKVTDYLDCDVMALKAGSTRLSNNGLGTAWNLHFLITVRVLAIS